jgi:hypothetical protein
VTKVSNWSDFRSSRKSIGEYSCVPEFLPERNALL